MTVRLPFITLQLKMKPSYDKHTENKTKIQNITKTKTRSIII